MEECEICNLYDNAKIIWEDDICWIGLIEESEYPIVALTHHYEDCTTEEWNHIWYLVNLFFKKDNRIISYSGHGYKHWFINIIIEEEY